MTEISPHMAVGQLVVERPSRARILEQFGIDYCCGGQQTLGEACAAQRIDTQEVVSALREADLEPVATEETDWAAASLDELIANILNEHHAYLRRELPRLSGLTAKVHSVHGQRHPELAEVRQTYDALRAELEAHLMKEEQILFPLIRAMESFQTLEAVHCGSVQNPIRAMEHEHNSAGAALAQMRKLTGDFTPPGDGCNTYRAMLDGLAGLEADLHRHIHKENNILFPRATELEATMAQARSAGNG
ncbi:MAG: iron-sulfur cluster repair di-iron protein [Phycisphaerae bacterium]|nr:iron-sulfur cluster repair di-iron protein [Phycisphaerae bacterium]